MMPDDALVVDTTPIDAAELTPDTLDINRVYHLDDLQAMPAAVLEELWLACPEKAFYEAALRRAVDDTYGPEAVPSDIDQLRVIERSILYYTGQHTDLPDSAPRIPVSRRADGTVQWFKVSDRIREHVHTGTHLADSVDDEDTGTDLRRVLPVIALGLTLVCVLVMIIRSAATSEALSEADLTATVEAGEALREGTITPTPLALDNIDRPIEAGEDLRGYYPVLLEIAPATAPARVFPVQQREVDIAEWLFDRDPDVASAVLGLVIQPVLGIPYSEANAAFLSDLQAGDAIHVRMSTGQTLQFEVTGQERVDRQAVDIFAQDTPGIALVMLDDPAGDRLVIRGDYLVSQEALQASTGNVSVSRQGESINLGENLTLTVLGSRQEQGSLVADSTYRLVDLELSADVALDTGDLTVELLDSSGTRYTSANAPIDMLTYEPLTAVALQAGDTVRVTAAFITPSAPSNYVLVVRHGEFSTRVLLTQPQAILNASYLEVLITGVEVEDDDLLIGTRIYNPYPSAISLTPTDVRLVSSPQALEDTFPVGPPIRDASGQLPLTIDAGEFQDVVFRFPWSDEVFIGLEIGGTQFIASGR